MRRLPLYIGLAFMALAWTVLVSVYAHAQGRPMVLHHDLRVTLNPEKQGLSGTDTVTVKPHGSDRISFTLSARARIQGISIAEEAIPFRFEDGKLRVSIPKHLEDDLIQLSVSYEAFFRGPIPEDPIHTEDPSCGVAGVVSSRGTFLSSRAGRYPEIPGSKSTFRLLVAAPQGVVSVTAGKRLEMHSTGGRSISLWEASHTLEGIALSARPYQVKETHACGIPVYTYLLPETQHLADTYLEATARYLSLYNELIGPYPFQKFAVVENFFPTGCGFPSYTLLGSRVIRLPFIVRTSLGHEVAHSWWGNSVLVDYTDGNWSKALTTFVADHLFKEQLSPEEGRVYRLQILRNYANLVPPEEDFPLKAFIGRMSAAFQAVGYGKGAMVFHMARRIVGDGVFWQKACGMCSGENVFEPPHGRILPGCWGIKASRT